MEYINKEEDFINRTLYILEQYRDYKKSSDPNDSYEVTLLLNCLLGLLILPKEHYYKRIPEERIADLDWNLNGISIEVETNGEIDKNPPLREIIHGLRNCIGHFGSKTTPVEVGGDMDDNNISIIKFKGSFKYGPSRIFKKIKAEFCVINEEANSLELFVKKLASLLNVISKEG